MVIWLASYPRSGNWFARIAFKHLFGLTTNSVYDENRPNDRPLRDLIGNPLDMTLEEMAATT
jgi:hypothetical protein